MDLDPFFPSMATGGRLLTRIDFIRIVLARRAAVGSAWLTVWVIGVSVRCQSRSQG